MKTGRTLTDLAAELCRQANVKRDFLVPAEDLHVSTNGHSVLSGTGQIGAGYTLKETAHGQLAEYTGVPKAFYDRLRASSYTLRVPTGTGDALSDRDEFPIPVADEPLFDLVVNRLLQEKGDQKRLVRTLDGRARAFLSESFDTDLDNYDVFRVAAKVITEADLEPKNVVSCEVTERKLYLKVVSPRLQATIDPSNLTRPHGGQHYLKEPQVVQAGFVLTNSETGLGALKVETVIMKLMCTNLWITETAYRKRHLGRVLEADEEGHLYRSDTRAADANAQLLKLRDHVAEVLDEQRFLALVGKMQETAEVPLGPSIDKTVEATARKFGLTQSEKESVVRNLIEGADLSLWGLSNAITQTAQAVESYDRATDLEAIGGKFFTLPAHELREIINV